MNDGRIGMVEAAKGLARNPLGIIALFIVLVYGFASLVTAFAGSFTNDERLLLVYFLVSFPVLVLLVFLWLVIRHSEKLFAPSDFKNEDNYVKMQMRTASFLVAASAKNPAPGSQSSIEQIIETVQDTIPQRRKAGDGWRHHILWVDDRPENNVYERQAFEAVGLSFSLALSTKEALDLLASRKFGAVISDMGRKEGSREGYVLLDTMRQKGDETPLFFYASSNAPEHKRETLQHGGQGCTNNAQDLFRMVTEAVMTVD